MKKLFYVLAFALTLVLNANAQYKLGDYYEKDGLKGIVVCVDDSGSHGLIMSLDHCAKKWLNDKDEKFNTNAYHEDDGEKNMAIIEKYINDNGKTWEMFPFFNWCRSLGEGWYAPATDELREILNTINGGVGSYNAKNMKAVIKTLKKHKGDDLISSGYGGSKCPLWMYSSTEGDAGMVFSLMFKEKASSQLVRGMASGIMGSPTPKGEFIIESITKTHTGGKFAKVYGSRAVHKF